jgi:hypothetical protein
MATASTKSVLNDFRQVERAVALIQLGARLQVLESETDLSYERLLRLYKEVAGKSPSKGQLPFSTDWFLTWQPNIHASLFLNTYEYLSKVSELDDIAIANQNAAKRLDVDSSQERECEDARFPQSHPTILPQISPQDGA